jgi:hypothetical protein
MTVNATTLLRLTQKPLPRGWSYKYDAQQGVFSAPGLRINLRVGDRVTQLRCHIIEAEFAGDPSVWLKQLEEYQDAVSKVPTIVRAIRTATTKSQPPCRTI